MRKRQKLKRELLENAHDFINAALESAEKARSERDRWRFALLHLVQGIELLVKERLRQEHALLVYENLENPGRTISFERAMQRLQSIGVLLDPQETARIHTARKLRNEMTHYRFKLDLKEAKDEFALLYEFASSFHDAHLGSELHAAIYEDWWEIEAETMDRFRRDFVLYNGQYVPRAYPAEIVEAQNTPFFEILGETYPRIRYGAEGDLFPDFPSPSCPDCDVLKGQIHVVGCDAEACPRCLNQFISCPCYDEGQGSLFEDEERRMNTAVCIATISVVLDRDDDGIGCE